VARSRGVSPAPVNTSSEYRAQCLLRLGDGSQYHARTGIIRSVTGQRRGPRSWEGIALSVTEEFVAQCSAAVKEDRGASAVKEVVERAVLDRRLIEELPLEAGVNVLHGADDLTILHVVMAERPAGPGNPIPHNHQLWALIGVVHGSEENEFF